MRLPKNSTALLLVLIGASVCSMLLALFLFGSERSTTSTLEKPASFLADESRTHGRQEGLEVNRIPLKEPDLRAAHADDVGSSPPQLLKYNAADDRVGPELDPVPTSSALDGIETSGLIATRAELRSLLKEHSEKEFNWRFETGQYEVVGQGSEYTFTAEDAATASAIRIDPATQEIRRVVLLEHEFPELYKLRKEVSRIDEELAARERDAVVAQRDRDGKDE